jgi:opacity protein-like surface antigen
MLGKNSLRKKIALATSLVLAAATIGTAASAAAPRPRDPVCDQRVADGCVVFWQDLGYAQYSDCVSNEQCLKCPPNYGYLCGYDPRFAYDPAIKPDQPW